MDHHPECSPTNPLADDLMCRPAPGSWATAAFGREWNSPVQAEQDARRMFHRALSQWAMDVLALRRRGLDRPGRVPFASAPPVRRAA